MKKTPIQHRAKNTKLAASRSKYRPAVSIARYEPTDGIRLVLGDVGRITLRIDGRRVTFGLSIDHRDDGALYFDSVRDERYDVVSLSAPRRCYPKTRVHPGRMASAPRPQETGARMTAKELMATPPLEVRFAASGPEAECLGFLGVLEATDGENIWSCGLGRHTDVHGRMYVFVCALATPTGSFCPVFPPQTNSYPAISEAVPAR